MEDIICTVPEACGESDCPAGWHLAHYWIYDDGTYSVCDSGGNHDPCDADDVPTTEEHDRLWREYHAHVARTGDDQVGEFGVPRETKRKERYTAAFRKSICGAVLARVTRGGKEVPRRDLPQHVIDYLCVDRQPGAAGLMTFSGGWDALLALDCVTLHRGTARVTFTVEAKTPRPAAVIARELRKAARLALRERV